MVLTKFLVEPLNVYGDRREFEFSLQNVLFLSTTPANRNLQCVLIISSEATW